LDSYQPLTLNKWQNLAFTLSSPTAFIYIDGVLTGNGMFEQYNIPQILFRSINFIGKGNWYSSLSTQSLLDADLDEIKIFNQIFKFK